MNSTDSPHLPRRPLLVIAVFSALTISACASSDTDTGAQDSASAAQSEVDTDGATPIGDGSDEAPIGIDDSGNIDFSSDVDAALDSVGFDAIVDIAAGQLDPEPDVEINGDAATLTFAEGSLESDSWLPCSVLTALVSGDQTVTVVYPDGEKLC